LASREVFQRVFTLLRHILQEPFDAPEQAPAAEPTAQAQPRAKRARRSSAEFSPLYRHLIERLDDLEGSYRSDQEAALRYDIEHILIPFGFLAPVKGRPQSRRQGYAIGTALLSADQLRQPKRALAHRSFTEEKPGTLSEAEMGARVERAIRDRRRAWPLQLLFHNISWYLAFETF
ncbi:MAG: hypothetical protein VKK98_10645, partial [Cyanobacteriota bacterium]|nr:hypothetical protein [Cyanobacteriota bacterium]